MSNAIFNKYNGWSCNAHLKGFNINISRVLTLFKIIKSFVSMISPSLPNSKCLFGKLKTYLWIDKMVTFRWLTIRQSGKSFDIYICLMCHAMGTNYGRSKLKSELESITCTMAFKCIKHTIVTKKITYLEIINSIIDKLPLTRSDCIMTKPNWLH